MYDLDKSCTIDLEEFVAILSQLDPSLELQEVEKTFELVGAGDSMDEEKFWLWCKNIFGEVSDSAYTQEMIGLLKAGQQRQDGDRFNKRIDDHNSMAEDEAAKQDSLQFKREWYLT